MELVNVVRSRQDGFLHSNLFTEQSCLIHNTFCPYNHHFSKWSNWRWAKKNCINFEEEKSYLGQLERGECKRKVGDGEGSICLYSNLLCTCLAPQSPAPFSLSLSLSLWVWVWKRLIWNWSSANMRNKVIQIQLVGNFVCTVWSWTTVRTRGEGINSPVCYFVQLNVFFPL